ncbi:hypothetical protein [Tepidibacter hydrothermalis]|uniref:Uncharacterized protein n=1 Tax=Tepidibacter hydrothermalis TaxID=3036126 RepID=A0ABY8EB37_9FIRM|nr:hypothetical protein [Tepidibacter hydrothermalis]WFD08727.1 hypothetical protein P4S50_09990 [Tepidibacter hydrothermalis]
MKRNFKFIFTLAMIVSCMMFYSFSVFADTVEDEEKKPEFEWVGVDNGTLNYDSSKGAYNPMGVVYNNELYVIWNESHSSGPIQIRAKKYNGSKWVEVDNGSLNYDKSKTAYHPMGVVYNNELYVTWYENTGTHVWQIRVKKYDGSKWVGVDNGTLNYDFSKNGYDPMGVVYNDDLYVTWHESHSQNSDQIRVKKYDGSKWVEADNGFLNYDSSGSARNPIGVVYNNELYVIWYEHGEDSNQIRVKKYDGSKWVEADNGSLNYNSSKGASYPMGVVYNNELYVTWMEHCEYNGKNIFQIRVKKYDGSKWVGVDNGTLNYDKSQTAYYPMGVVYNNELYVIWHENNGSSIWQIRAKKYNGSKWVGVDNGTLSYDSSKEDLNNPMGVVYNNELYVTWHEESESNIRQIRMKKLVNNKGTGSEKPSNKGERALLRITMEEGTEKEYDMTMKEVNDFIDWYNKISTPCYTIEKDYNVGPFESRKDYIVRDKIVSFEVMEYNK